MPKRRIYSAEFKREAVALASQPGVTKAQIGREMDINPNMITRWQRMDQRPFLVKALLVMKRWRH